MNQEETNDNLSSAVNDLHDLNLVRASTDGTDRPPIPTLSCNSQGIGGASNEGSPDKQQEAVALFPAYEDAHIIKTLPTTYRLVRKLLCSGQFEEAQLLCEEKIKKIQRNPDNFLESIANEILAIVYWAAKKHVEATEVLSKALDVRSTKLGHKNLIIAATLNNLAMYHGKIGNYFTGQNLCRTALRIKQKLLDDGHFQIARQYYNLGVLYQIANEYDGAAEFYEMSLNIYEKQSGPEDPLSQTVKSNLETCIVMCEVQKTETPQKFPRALKRVNEELQNETGQLRLEVGGDENVSIDQCQQKKAKLTEERLKLNLPASGSDDNQDVGEASAQDSLDKSQLGVGVVAQIKNDQLFECHPAIIDSTILFDDTSSIAIDIEVQLLLDEGLHDQAETFCGEKIYELRKSRKTKLVKLRMANILTSLASVYKSKKEYLLVIEVLCNILKILERVLGKNHLTVGIVLNNLAVYNGIIGNFLNAQILGARSLQIKLAHLGPKHHRVGGQFYNIGVFNQNQQQYLIAEECYKKARDIFKWGLGSDSPDMMIPTTSNLATCLLMQGKTEEAKSLQKQFSAPKHDDQELQNQAPQLPNEDGRARTISAYQCLQTSEKLGEETPSSDLSTNGSESSQDVDAASNQDSLDKQGVGSVTDSDNDQLVDCYPAFLDATSLNDGTNSNVIREVIQCLINENKHEEAKTFCEETIEELRKSRETKVDDLFIADNLYTLASVYGATKEHQKVIPMLSYVLKILERELGDSHPSVGTVLTNLAVYHGAVGDFTDAEALSKRSLRIKKEHFGIDDLLVGSQLYNLGVFSHLQLEYHNAEEYYRKAEDILKLQVDLDPRHMRAVTHNLLDCLMAQGKIDKAEALQLQKQTAQLPQENGRARTISAYQYPQTSGKLEEEQSHLELAAGGSGVGLVADVGNNQLAGCYPALLDETIFNHGASPNAIFKEVKFLIAKDMHEEAKTFCEETINELRMTSETKVDDLRIADILYILGAVYEARKEYQKIIPIVSDVLKILERELGDNHLSVAAMLNNLGVFHGKVGNYIDAKVLCEKSLRIKIGHLGFRDPQVARLYHNIGVFNQKQHKYHSAEKCYKKAREIYKLQLELDPGHMLAATSNLVACLMAQGKNGEAEEFKKHCEIEEATETTTV